jgi:hypothetical protein
MVGSQGNRVKVTQLSGATLALIFLCGFNFDYFTLFSYASH